MVSGRLLLISNSTQHGRGYLDHVEAEMRELLLAVRSVLFVPFAMFDRPAYAAKTKVRLETMGFAVDSLDGAASNPRSSVERAEAIFVGGGNTFRLLKALQDLGLVDAIRRRVEAGMPYIGSSAGSIVAGPTLKTTKDMPIVQPASFEALALVDYQISPHYLDPDPASKHMGETQEERIQQFLEKNDAPVVGLREGAFLRVEHEEVVLVGATGARIFRRGRAPVEAQAGVRIDSLIRGSPT
jgi:dipeptidase E